MVIFSDKYHTLWHIVVTATLCKICNCENVGVAVFIVIYKKNSYYYIISIPVLTSTLFSRDGMSSAILAFRSKMVKLKTIWKRQIIMQ
jgi:hypothetical protein